MPVDTTHPRVLPSLQVVLTKRPIEPARPDTVAWSRPAIAPAQLLRQAGASAGAGPFRVVPEDVDGKC